MLLTCCTLGRRKGCDDNFLWPETGSLCASSSLSFRRSFPAVEGKHESTVPGNPVLDEKLAEKTSQGGALDARKKLGESEQPWPLPVLFFSRKLEQVGVLFGLKWRNKRQLKRLIECPHGEDLQAHYSPRQMVPCLSSRRKLVHRMRESGAPPATQARIIAVTFG